MDDKGRNVMDDKPQVNRQNSVAIEVLNDLEILAKRALDLGARASDQLYSVCAEPAPVSELVETPPPPIADRPYPPLFSSMREQMRLIEDALVWVTDVLDRCEIR